MNKVRDVESLIQYVFSRSKREWLQGVVSRQKPLHHSGSASVVDDDGEIDDEDDGAQDYVYDDDPLPTEGPTEEGGDVDDPDEVATDPQQ